jgi:flagellar M-ring protein FliF
MAKETDSRLKGIWGSLTPGQRMIIGGSVAAIIATVAVGALIVSRASYSVLYSGLAPEEAGQVIEKLDQRNIPYRLRGGGGTVLVPTGKVYSSRIELASEGLPRSGSVGFEIFDKTVFGMTEFVQKINYRRALEGELAKTISQMEEVEGVRVHIVVPERTLFRSDEGVATASVVLRVNPARPLEGRHIEGIAYLVASSVEGLEPDRVTILDSRGTLLSRGFSDGQPRPGEGLEMKKQVEAYLEDKAQTLLDGVLGPGKSVVRVSVVLNLEQIERNTEHYDPENAAVRSEERVENSDGEGGGRSETSVTNYELDRTVESIAGEVGNIERLSVAVMVDGTYEDGRGGAGTTFVPRSDEELAKITSIVKSALGFETERNDYFEIASIAFDRQYLAEQEKGMEKMLKMQFYMSIARKAAYVIGLVLALVFILKLVKKIGGIVGSISTGSGSRIDITDRGEGFALPPSPASAAATAANEVANRIAELAARNPDQAATVIGTMVGEGK